MSLYLRVRDHFRKNPSASLSRSQIAAELGLGPRERKGLEGVLMALVGAGELEQTQRRYRRAKPPQAVEGVFHAARGGYGFVTPDGMAFDADLFVPARATLGAFDGDRVLASLFPRREGASPEARVLKILARSRRAVVGIVQGGYLLPMGASMPPVALVRGAVEEGRVAAAILEEREGPPRASGVVPLGSLDDPLTPIRAAEARFGLRSDFPADAEEEAASFGPVRESDLEGRSDFTSLPTLTIDPEDAKDFDDAISVEPEGQGWRLWVHIADVSHYVPPGGALDREARERGNSTYLPRTVYPMLPHRLSSGLCSLVPGDLRLVFTAEMRLDARGNVKGARFHKGVIRSMARLHYAQAQAILDGGEEAPGSVKNLLANAHALFKVLFQRRLRLGTLDLDMPEAALRFGLSGRVEEVLPEVRLDSHRVIEEAMLAANETVARTLVERGAPALFRVHDTPNAEKLEALRPLLNALGFGEASRGDLSDPFVLQGLLERTQGHRAAKLVAYLVLRAMAQARYSATCLPHYGLGFAAYCHFTSPIRRYPDLVVHRALEASLWGGPGAPRELDSLAAHCSRTERASDQAEREVLGWYQMAFLASRMGEVFDALVLGFTRFGARIELLDHLIEGICPFQAMEGEFVTVDQDGLSARGRYSGARLCVGQSVKARLVRVDRLAGEAQFVLEDWPGQGPGRRAGEPGNRGRKGRKGRGGPRGR